MNAVLELLCSGFLVIRNSWNKRRIQSAVLIRGRGLLTFLSQMRRLFEGGGYSRTALIRVNTVCKIDKTVKTIRQVSTTF